MDDETSLNDLFNKFKIPFILTLVGSVLLIGGIFSSNLMPQSQNKTKSSKTTPINNSSFVSVSSIKVDVQGSVQNPGVYTLPPDSRVEDAIKIAGGLTKESDGDYISKHLTLSQKVSDGSKIYIPKIGENIVPVSSTSVGSVAGSSVISINNSSLSDLDNLPGVGQVTAQKIIDNRPYNDINELLIKKAVTKATFEKIKEKISL